MNRKVGDWVIIDADGSIYDEMIGVIHEVREGDPQYKVNGYKVTTFVEHQGKWYADDTTFKREYEVKDIGSRIHPNVVPLPDITDDYKGYLFVDEGYLKVGCQTIPFSRIAQLQQLLDAVAPEWRKVTTDEQAGVDTRPKADLPF